MVVLLLLGAVLAGRLTRVWVERRRGSAGSRLHVRLVLLFSGVAVIARHRGGGVRDVLLPSRHPGLVQRPRAHRAAGEPAGRRGYLEEHRNNIRTDALGMANDLTRAGAAVSATIRTCSPRCWARQTTLRGLTEAVIYEPVTGR